MGMTKGEQAILHLRPAFSDKGFTFEEARDYLATTSFGNFVKQSWNSLVKKGLIELDKNGIAHFAEDEEEGPISSEWTNTHRRHFECGDQSGFGDFFTEEELEFINQEYFVWKATGERWQEKGFRRPNLPEVISEGLPSALFGWARTNHLHLINISNSADLVDTTTGDAIQVKGISVYGESDGGPTSFGPNTQFDRLIVIHVRLDEDKAYFYEMDAVGYKDWKVNGQMSLREQQAQGKRPRLPLLPIIREQGLAPFATYDFHTSECI